MRPKDAEGIANSVDPDQIAPLIWVCTVCPALPVRKLRIITVRALFNQVWKYFRVVTMEFYGRNDITLGGFLERFCFRLVIRFFLLYPVVFLLSEVFQNRMSHLMRLWYLSHRRPAKAQASLHICIVSPEPLLFAPMKYEVDEGSNQKSDI